MLVGLPRQCNAVLTYVCYDGFQWRSRKLQRVRESQQGRCHGVCRRGKIRTLLCDCLSVSIRLPTCPSIHPLICLSESVCLSIGLFVRIGLSVCLPICHLSIHLSVYPFIHPSICLSVYISINLSACLSVYLSNYLFIYLPVSTSVCLYKYVILLYELYPIVCVFAPTDQKHAVRLITVTGSSDRYLSSEAVP